MWYKLHSCHSLNKYFDHILGMWLVPSIADMQIEWLNILYKWDHFYKILVNRLCNLKNCYNCHSLKLHRSFCSLMKRHSSHTYSSGSLKNLYRLHIQLLIQNTFYKSFGLDKTQQDIHGRIFDKKKQSHPNLRLIGSCYLCWISNFEL